jgi:type II secretory pathway component PulF
VALLRTVRGQRCWHRLLLRLPLAGTLTAKAVVAQFAQMTVMLLRAGVPFVEAMTVVRQSIRNRVLADELEAIRTAVEAGSDIAPALCNSRIFPPLVVHLMAVGQETGELTAMLEQLRAGYEQEVRLAVGKFTAALEPLLIVILAAVIGFVIFATLMPILEATRVMG